MMDDYRLRFDMPKPLSGPAGVTCRACGFELTLTMGLGVLGVGQMFSCDACRWTNMSPHPPLSHCQKCGQFNTHGHECDSA